MLRTTRLRAAEAEKVENLEKENSRLRQLVRVLKIWGLWCSLFFCLLPGCCTIYLFFTFFLAQLAERASDGATKSGYLNKYRAHATSSLWANTWEARYVILRGQHLTYFRSERDVAYPPRGQISLEGTYVDLEGLKRRKFWTFRVVDRAGVDLVRLSTEVQSDYMSWVEALERAGCTIRRGGEYEEYRTLSPSPSQTSPGTSAISDSDTATSSRPSRSGQYEVDSQADRGPIRSQPSGYTSDASDVAAQRPTRQRPRSSGRRSARGGPYGFETCAPVHTQPRFSLLSSERISFSNQSGLLTLVFIVLARRIFDSS